MRPRAKTSQHSSSAPDRLPARWLPLNYRHTPGSVAIYGKFDYSPSKEPSLFSPSHLKLLRLSFNGAEAEVFVPSLTSSSRSGPRSGSTWGDGSHVPVP